ncbi:uncharacterized protein LOC125946844 [Dermacentor silvarum]|uniref:uncharacterized protein LOC125946844 n=1 Tax=Dermacentor silvarum TaxID=543639 RepID=UPI0021011BEB|nr:uncharacterized protein LOC125946844 [Dermacentor silvarum]
MRTEICLVLPLLFTPAFGGGGHSKVKASSPCAGYTVARSCAGQNSGFHYYRPFRLCLKSDNRHCGNGANVFSSCEQCSRKCIVSVCSEEITTPAPEKLPQISPFGR